MARCLIAAGICGAASWTVLAAVAWFRYGRPDRVDPEWADPLLERVMPVYDVADRHRTRVAAPAEIAFAAAANLNLRRSTAIRAIFRVREWIVGSGKVKMAEPAGLLAWARALGWGLLGEVPGREVVLGAATKPWEANVVFRALPAEKFKGFGEPGYVKIVWTLRADAAGAAGSIARTETRVTATDERARAKFRLYWAFFWPGIVSIRRIALGMVKREAARLESGARRRNSERRHSENGAL